MILKSICDYVLQAGRVEESLLLKHFHLRQEGLNALMSPLLKRGKIQKTLHQRGEKLTPLVYYSYPSDTQIPSISIV
ncbi:FeoC-like transcriptional regulator [Psychromonas sp. Urea-02u-13]|uniref:FeoC-like transcriptional regulator n=1 Tax=Psychromonas sp. Urea-02u-13 TaxID=2058326 RepID=UPI0012FF4F6C|nr:FeoC-like transcriptional regulator [Psychromonas sp. Urea-02u-13]